MRVVKTNLGWPIIIALTIIPLLRWATLIPLSDRFATVEVSLTSIGQMAGLAALILFSLNFVLSTRLKFLEDFFGGMNKVYLAHHIVGGSAFILFMLHPLLMALSRYSFSPQAAALLLIPSTDWPVTFGITALLSAMTLLVITFFVQLPYQWWLWTHKLMGVAFAFVALHILLIPSDISVDPLLRTYSLFFVTVGLLAYSYHTILGRFVTRGEKYSVSQVKRISKEVVEVQLRPSASKAINYKPGQFVFVSFKSEAVSKEIHPFSISSIPDSKGNLEMVIKSEGDFTTSMANLKPGDKAFVEGSFGRFTFSLYPTKEQIWIGGGIGITPFLGMARSLTNFPEYKIDLYYSVKEESEAVYLNEFQQIAKQNKNFRILAVVSSKVGRLTADQVKKQSGEVANKEIFICGPPPMMAAMRYDLKRLGAKNSQIHTEEFAIQ